MQQPLRLKIFYYTVAIIAGLFFIFPIYWTLVTSFKSYKEAFTQPPTLFVLPKIQNYLLFFQSSDITRFLTNSIVITTISVLISMVIGIFASYALTRAKFPGKEGLGLFLLASRFIPPISTLIPIYLIFRKVGLYDTRTGLILLNCAMNIPYVVWMMRGFIKEVPIEVEESAWVDGAGKIRTMLNIVLPMCRSGMAATAVLIMVFTWNEYLYAMMMTSVNAKTLPLSMIAYMGERGIDWNMMATSGIIILFPTIVFSILTHRNLGSGLSFGAVKG